MAEDGGGRGGGLGAAEATLVQTILEDLLDHLLGPLLFGHATSENPPTVEQKAVVSKQKATSPRPPPRVASFRPCNFREPADSRADGGALQAESDVASTTSSSRFFSAMQNPPTVEQTARATSLDQLVEPLLPGNATSGKPLVSKQMHSIVILYNCYYRKQIPQLQYFNDKTFYEKAVIIKPCLSKFMGFSLKKAIIEACNISSTLYASTASAEIEEWPISRIAVFLVDSKCENCFLEFGSVTMGIWSLMEIDLDEALAKYEDTKMQAAGSKRPSGCSYALLGNEDGHDQLALSMVEEKTGIDHSNFHILECHVTYSLSKQKTASRWYIIKSVKTIYDDIKDIQMIPLVDLQDKFASLRDRLLGTSQAYEDTIMAEYYHLLPYLNILSNWLPRRGTLNAHLPLKVNPADVHEQGSLMSDKVHSSKNDGFHRSSDKENQTISMSSRNASLIANESASKQKYPSSGKDSSNAICIPEINSIGSSFRKNKLPALKDHCLSGEFSSISNKSSTCSQITLAGSCEIGLSLAVSEPCKVDTISSLNQLQKPSPGRENIVDRRGPETSLKRGSERSQFYSNSAKNGLADKIGGLDKKPRIIESKDRELFLRIEGSQTVQDATIISVTDHPLVPFHYPEGYEFHHLMASKKDELQETSLRVLQRKRDDLTQQLRHLEDESAQCEMNIEAVRTGREGSLKLELESIIDACNAFCSSQMSVVTSLGGNHPQIINSKGLSRNSCKELDDICWENKWMLPRYTVVPSLTDGNFRANVTVKGFDFENTVYGNSKGNPSEARFSAASVMLSQLYSMTT